MSLLNTINSNCIYKQYSCAGGVKPPQPQNNSIINFISINNTAKIDSKSDLKIRQLKEEFMLAKNEQGCIGKAWNTIKNFFNTDYSSNSIENAINSMTTNSTNEEFESIRNMITEYRHKQDLAVDTIGTIGSTVAAGTAGANVGGMLGSVIGNIFPGAGTIAGGLLGTTLGFVGGAILGVAAKVGISQLENITDNVDNNAFHNDKNIGKQVLLGAIAGVNAMLFDGIAEKISGVCKSAFKLTKEGFAISTNGMANVTKTVGLNALSEGMGGAAASIVVCDSEYFIDCAIEEDTEFSWSDLVQTTGISAVTGGIISAGFGAATGYKDVKNFNNLNKKTLNDVELSLIKDSERISQNTSDIHEYHEFIDLSFENLIYECSFYRIDYLLANWLKKSLKKVTAIHGEKAFTTKEENK